MKIDKVCSVVAVHGIGAHPDDTWCKNVGSDDNGGSRTVNWLSDPEMLPGKMPDARIMRYGYHSEWFGRDAIQQSASRVAPGILHSLKRARNVRESLYQSSYQGIFILAENRNSFIAL